MEFGEPSDDLDPWPHLVVIMSAASEADSLLVHHFRQRGSAVVHVDDEKAVLRAVQEQVPDVIVVERHEAGEMTTRELIDRLRQDPDTRSCRIVVASGLQFAEVVPGEPGVHEVGAAAVIDEPYTRSSVRRLVDELDDTGPAGQAP